MVVKSGHGARNRTMVVLDVFGQRAAGSGASLALQQFESMENPFTSPVKMCSSHKLSFVENLSSQVSSFYVINIKSVFAKCYLYG